MLRKYIPSCLHDILFSKHTLESAKHAKPETNPSPLATTNSPGPETNSLTTIAPTVDLSEAIALYESSRSKHKT